MTITRRGARTLASLLVLFLLAVPALATESESVEPQKATEAAPAAEKSEAAPNEKKAGNDEATSKVCRPSPAKVNTLEELRAGDAKRFDAALNPTPAATPAPQPAEAKKKDAPDDEPR